MARKGAAALEAEAADLGLGQVRRQLEGPGAGLRLGQRRRARAALHCRHVPPQLFRGHADLKARQALPQRPLEEAFAFAFSLFSLFSFPFLFAASVVVGGGAEAPATAAPVEASAVVSPASCVFSTDW